MSAPSEVPEGQAQASDPRAEHLHVRQVTAAWRRIESWLRMHAPDSHALLEGGASEGEIRALEEALGAEVPAPLQALWRLCAGVHSSRHSAFMLGRRALMSLSSVLQVHRTEMDFQRQEDERQPRGDDEFTFWRPGWIPVLSFRADDFSSGLYLDTATGLLCYWSRFAERWPKYESLTAYLEEMADALETPGLIEAPKPGLIDGSLVWGPPTNPDQRALWVPFAG
ncbi:SMI1/KNR4 family protein [Streptomyces triticagri]|uniref:SMI1/KNR4 family protein n=2 Tax=Streptomyces triticagri TaxID=2293568 RepID=A0A372M5K9_9ACTN|nr:SMI1/KNR4 family protein [Streptomyces triticagri]